MKQKTGYRAAPANFSCWPTHGDQGGTFNGNPLMCAVGLSVMQTVLADGFLAQVRTTGDYLGERLQALCAQYGLGAARGVGLLRALDLGQPWQWSWWPMPASS